MSNKTASIRRIFLPTLFTLLLCFNNLNDALSAGEAKFSKVYSEKGTSIKGTETVNSISFNVAVPDIVTSEVNEKDGAVYHKISIPDASFLTEEEGAPQLPYISELIRLPDNASNVLISVSFNTAPRIYNEILIYPCPRKVIKTTTKGCEYIAEEFYIDPGKYNNDNAIPQARAEIVEDGYFRSIRMARINIYPLRYAASKQILEFANELTVTVTWTTVPEYILKRDTTKGFEKLISNMTLNDAAYTRIEKPDSSAEASACAGSVRYITGAELKDTAINCDYLIITHQNFFSTPGLDSFADYRAGYSELNVVVVKTDDIYAQFPNVGGNGYSIKDFMQYAYDNWRTAPQYLLIVGDVGYVPSYQLPPFPGWHPMDYDEWYICLSGADAWPDMAMGRFPIESENDITAIKDKVISYEQNPIILNDYHKKVLYLEGSAGNAWESMNTLINAGFELSELYNLNIAGGLWGLDIEEAINNGQNLVCYHGHGNVDRWEDFRGFWINSDLHNFNKYPVILTTACWTAHLSMEGIEGCAISIGKQFIIARDKGAVAYYGATVESGVSAAHDALSIILDNFSYELGKAILAGEILQNVLLMSKEYILLGDPALRVFGYGISHDLPDLTLSSSGVSYDYINHELTIEVNNIGEADANGVTVRVFIVDDVTGAEYPFGEYTFTVIAAGSKAAVVIEQAPPFRGEFNIIARIDPDNTINESNELNNQNGKRNMMDPAFIDVSDRSGIVWGGPDSRCPYIVKADVNKDGYEDIYIGVSSDSSFYPKLLLNNGDGTFRDVTGSSNIGNQFTSAAAFGDVNNDGYPDLCLGATGGNKLLLNNEVGTFSNITTSSGIGGYSTFTQITFGDVNNDGYLDLYAIMTNNTNALFINKGDNSFTDETAARGLSGEKSCGGRPVFVDIDNDGDSDLFTFVPTPVGFSQTKYDYIRGYKNCGNGYFSENIIIPYVDYWPMYIAITDVDLDGDLDFIGFGDTKDARKYLTRYWRNMGTGVFEKVLDYNVSTKIYESSSYRADFAEIDNMPGEDLIWAKYFIRNSGKGTFMKYEDTSCGKSYDYGSEISIPIDIDGDGDNDIIRAARQGFVQVLRNQINNHDWLKVKPVGSVSNRDAIGTKVYVYSSKDELVGFQEVSCEKPAPLCFGVNSEDEYKVVVTWPKSGLTNVVEHVATAQTITVAEGGTNFPPVLIPIGNKIVKEGEKLDFSVSAIDPEGLPVTISASPMPDDAATFNYNTFSWTPNYVQSGSYPVTFTASDGKLSVSETITITVNEVKSVWGDVSGDGRLDSPDSTLIRRYMAGIVQFNEEQKRLGDVTQNGAITELDLDYIRKAIVQMVTLPVTNHAPILADPGDQTTVPGDTLILKITATDPDSNPIICSADIPDDMAGAVFDPATLTLTWIPTLDQTGIHEFTVTATDYEMTGSRIVIVSVAVDNLNDPPEFINGINNRYAVIGRPCEFQVEARDPDDPATPAGQLSYSADNLPPGAGFDSGTRTFSWIPSEADKGTYEVTFTVSDNENSVSRKIFISTVMIDEKPVAADRFGHCDPAIYGDRIVWQGFDSAAFAKIYMYNVSTNTKTQLSEDPIYAYCDQRHPDINGDVVVWDSTQENRSGIRDIHAYRVSTGETSRISSIQPKSMRNPAIHDGTVVWEETTMYPYELIPTGLRSYDLTTGIERYHSSANLIQGMPSIFEGKVVYHTLGGGSPSDLYLFDVATNEEIQLTATAGIGEEYPSIYGDRVVYSGGPGCKVMMYSISNGEKLAIATGETLGIAAHPDIYEDRIVWEDGRYPFYDGRVGHNFNSDIFLYDAASKRELQVSYVSDSIERKPVIYQDIVVWEDRRKIKDIHDPFLENYDIYMARLYFAPLISECTPAEISQGGNITITGYDFGYTQGASYVTIDNNMELPVISWKNRTIVCAVPETARSGLLRVVTPGGASNGIGVTIIDHSLVSIELEGPSVWQLNGVRMGELKSNIDAGGNTLHRVRNTGDAPVNVDIRYVNVAAAGIRPGIEQGLDTFITKVGDEILQPDGNVTVTSIQPGASEPLSLTYGAPTQVSGGATNMSASYEIRAFPIDIQGNE